MCSSFYLAICILSMIHQSINGYNTDSTEWPDGSYALLQPRTGCPTGFKQGWIELSTGPKNNKSSTLHMQGKVEQKSILTYFCIGFAGHSNLDWPKGQYCIYSYRMPIYGEIRKYNKYHSNFSHEVGSFAYKWKWDTQTYVVELHFSCRTWGSKKIPIPLPITTPFYLLPYGSRDCQQVQWMVAATEWIKYHTRNYDGYRHRQTATTVPYHELGNFTNKGITMYYCYYESCNSTLNDTSGAFQSPGFPGEYPDGQLCSWRIIVLDNHTLVVTFTNFSLYEYDKDRLELYENESGVIKLKQAFFGHHQPFHITSASDMIFVFRSNEENNSTGFRAEYTMFITPEKTTTAAPTSPPTTTLPPTTTHPTTKLITTKLPTTKQPTTTLPTTKRPITTELETIFLPTTANDNSTRNETCQCNPTNSKNKYNKQTTHLVKKTFCEETWKTVVMVIPLAVLILITLVIIDIICRWRSKKVLKSEAKGSCGGDGMVVNPTYGRGSIVLDQPSGKVTDASMLNTVIAQSQSRDDLDDYEDVDYTQLNEIPPPRRSSKRQECHALDADTSAVFYHVLEPPNKEPCPPQSHVAMPVGNGGPDVFYHTLEPPTVSTGPAYQNPSDGNLYTLNPLYEAAENSVPLVEANKLLYDSYM